MGYEDPVVDQEILDHIDIGKDLERKFSAMDYSNYQFSTEGAGALAIGGTNEHWFEPNAPFKPGIETKLHGGLIVGIGAANIFSMVELYDKGNPPEAILSCDTQPEVVLAGRIITQALLDSDAEPNVYNNMTKREKMEQYYQEVCTEEKNPRIKTLFEISKQRTIDTLMTNSCSGSIFSDYTDIKLSKIFRENWSFFRDLASRGNLAFVLSDINNPKFVAYAQEKQAKMEGDTLVYLTNAIDHIVDRGWRLVDDTSLIRNPWKNIRTLQKKSNDNSPDKSRTFFVDTLGGKRLNYTLRFRDYPPTYSYGDFLVDPRPRWSPEQRKKMAERYNEE